MDDNEFDVDPKVERAVPLPDWKYPLLRAYNGFTGIERIQGWQLITWAINVGVLRKPNICSVSGSCAGGTIKGQPVFIQYHSENYYDPFGPKMIRQDLHKALHSRFKFPHTWERTVEIFGDRADDPWFVDLSYKEKDIASELRKQGWAGGKDMVDYFMSRLPVGAPKPFGRLLTLNDFDEQGQRKKNTMKEEPCKVNRIKNRSKNSKT